MTHSLRQQILLHARRLFLELGYHGLAMRLIADAVGVSKAALYYHFKDKEELFLAVVDDTLDEIEQLLDFIQSQEACARDRLRLFIVGVLNLPAEHRAMIHLVSDEIGHLSPASQAVVQSTYTTRFIQRLGAMLEAGMQNGELRVLSPHLATWALLGMLYPLISSQHVHDGITIEMADSLLTIYLDGLALPSVE